MTLDVRWHPTALDEFAANVDWYAARRDGLGDQFQAEVLRAVTGIADMTEAWPVWPHWDRKPTVRSKRVAGFPHRVVYFATEDTATIVAIAHARRRPGYWQDRITPPE